MIVFETAASRAKNGPSQPKCSTGRGSAGTPTERPIASAISRVGMPCSSMACSTEPAGADSTASRDARPGSRRSPWRGRRGWRVRCRVDRRERDEGVVDGAAGDTEAAEEVGEACEGVVREGERGGEARVDQAGGVGRGDACVAGESREDGVGLGEGVAAEGDLALVAPADDGGVVMVGAPSRGMATLVSSASGVNAGRRRSARTRWRRRSRSCSWPRALQSAPGDHRRERRAAGTGADQARHVVERACPRAARAWGRGALREPCRAGRGRPPFAWPSRAVGGRRREAIARRHRARFVRSAGHYTF